MKNSILIAAANAVLAIAGPVEKRAYVTEVATYYETVTVTEGSEPTPTAGVKQEAQPKVVVVTQTAGAQPAPEPTEEPEQPSVVIVTASPDPTTESPQPTQPAPTSEQVIEAPSSVAVEYPTPSAPSDDDFIGNALYHHNLHRANHSAPELSWDDKIAGYASNTAKTCHFGHDMYVNLFPFPKTELLMVSTGTKVKAATARTLPCGVSPAAPRSWVNPVLSSLPLPTTGTTANSTASPSTSTA